MQEAIQDISLECIALAQFIPFTCYMRVIMLDMTGPCGKIHVPNCYRTSNLCELRLCGRLRYFVWKIAMGTTSESMKAYSRQLDETEKLTYSQIILGLAISAIVLVGSTWGVLSLLNYSNVFNVNLVPANIVRYTTYMVLVSILATVVAIIILLLIIRWPSLVNLPLRIHRWRKKGIGEYFLSPEPTGNSFRNILRRSLYGSTLIVGISLTVIGIDLMLENGELIIPGGTFLLIASIIVLPITIMAYQGRRTVSS